MELLHDRCLSPRTSAHALCSHRGWARRCAARIDASGCARAHSTCTTHRRDKLVKLVPGLKAVDFGKTFSQDLFVRLDSDGSGEVDKMEFITGFVFEVRGSNDTPVLSAVLAGGWQASSRLDASSSAIALWRRPVPPSAARP